MNNSLIQIQFAQNLVLSLLFYNNCIQNLPSFNMSFVKEQVNANPNLKLFVLNLEIANNISQQEDNHAVVLRKIQYLSKTRMFNELQAQVANLKDMSFSTLKNKLEKAREKTLVQKKELGDQNIIKIIQELNEKSQNDQESQQIDIGQMNVYKLAKIYFDEGNYQKSHQILGMLERQGLKDFLWTRVPWARLYNEVILRKDEARRTIELVKKRFEEIENQQYKYALGKKQQLSKLVKVNYAQKQQFLSLCAIVYFNKPRDDDLQKFVDICNDKAYFSVIQLLSPYLLRYLCVAAILNKNLHKNRNYSFDLYKLTEIIKRGVVKYSDALIDFIQNLYVFFDFQSAAQNIQQIKVLVASDILLVNLKDRIIENCQFLYYKVYCKIHQSVLIKQIAQFTQKSQLQAQLWILKFIRSSDIDAKVDSLQGKLISIRNKQNRSQKFLNGIPNINSLINTLANAKIQDQ